MAIISGSDGLRTDLNPGDHVLLEYRGVKAILVCKGVLSCAEPDKLKFSFDLQGESAMPIWLTDMEAHDVTFKIRTQVFKLVIQSASSNSRFVHLLVPSL